MSIKISGILPGPTGEPAAHIGITLRAVKTSLTVVATLESNSITGVDGSYSLNVEPGKYDVLLWVDGVNARNIGTIIVYSDSLPGTLNNFLTALREEDGTPEIIRQLEQLRAEALQAALEARQSKDEATDQASIATTAAENAAQEAADLIKTAVKDDADRAEAARDDAEAAQLTVNTLAGEVAQHHTEVGQLAFVANESATHAAASSNSAAQFASESEGSKNAAAQSEQSALAGAGAAENSATAAAGDKAAAEGFRDEAEEFAAQAKTSAESIDMSALEQQISQKVDKITFNDAIAGKASNQALADGLAGKASNQQLTEGLSGKASKGANDDITQLNGLTKAITIAQGGTGAITAADARTKLGLGSAAVADVVANNADQTAGRAMTTGSNGIGGQAVNYQSVNNAFLHPTGTMGFVTATNWGGTTPTDTSGSLPAHWNVISFGVGNGQVAAGSRKAVIAIQSYNVGSGAPQCHVRTIHDTALSPSVMLYHTNNTTVDSNGFLKKASPVVKLYGDGSSETNHESDGATSERISEGVYKISGVLGFNSDDAWGGMDGGIEIPTDKNKQPLVWVDYFLEEDGDLIIKTYHRTHPASPQFAQNNIKGYEDGQPIDIPAGRFVDLRVQMPKVDVDDIVENNIN